MGSSLIVARTSSGGMNDNLTHAATFGQGSAQGSNTASFPETTKQIPVRDAGVVKNLFVYVSSNTATGVTSTVTLRVSATSAALTVSIGAGATGLFEDVTNTVSVADTDKLNWQYVVPDDVATKTLTIRTIGCEFVPTNTSNTVGFFVTSSQGNINPSDTNGASYYFAPAGRTSSAATAEPSFKWRARASLVATNFSTRIFSNSRTTTTSFATRLNGANGGQSLSVGAAATGFFEDTSGSDTLADGDDFNYLVTTGNDGATHSIAFPFISTRIVSTGRIFPLLSCLNQSSNSVNFNVTTWAGLGGDVIFTTTGGETANAAHPYFDFTAKNLGAYVDANTIATSPTTLTFRINGANSAVTVSIGAGSTGLFEDVTNTASVVSGDDLTYELKTPNTSGAMEIIWIGLLGQTPSAADSGISAFRSIRQTGQLANLRRRIRTRPSNIPIAERQAA